ncbi:ATP phosphoribosyltransferase regulatory subunit [Nocardia sp. NPDC058658]|uniref:ATP phosphoribosyltransferase regulatory subunit n=1 Tax=Nocardia sp. NPDC058658 TaxID=3346580 RepID=UPI0036496BFA
MRDLLPSDVAIRDHVLREITSTYRTFGFRRIEKPVLEDISRLQGGQGGDNEKLIFQVLRRGLSDPLAAETPLRELVDLGLRFDLTVPLTRFYGNNHVTLGQDYLPSRVGTASGITLGLAVSIGGLATPLIGGIADATSLRTALTPLILMPALSWLLFRTLPEPKTARDYEIISRSGAGMVDSAERRRSPSTSRSSHE